MNARERWQRTKSLFAEASELPREERDAFVERACGGDVELARDVFELLSTLDDTGRIPEIAEHRRIEPLDAFAGARAGDHELVAEVGRGGSGVVYRARNTTLGRIEAVKIQPHSFAPSKEQREHFLREARKLAKLDHPGIVRVHAVGEFSGGPYFAMEWIDGHDLSTEVSLQRLDVVPRPKGSPLLPPFSEPSYFKAVVEVVAQAAEALHHAHTRGIVHRDVKPQNLLLGRDGRVRVTDFGIARDSSMGSVTRTGQVAGTLHYMSPEQAEFERRPEVTHLTDVYSLGVVLFELLTLRRPFDAPTDLEILARITTGSPDRISRWNPRVPADLQTICEHAMETAAKNRYASAAELAQDLRRFLGDEPIVARPVSGLARFGRGVVRRRVPILSAAAACALVIGVLAAQRTYARAQSRDEIASRIATSRDLVRARTVSTDLRAAALSFESNRAELDDELRANADTFRAELDQLAEAAVRRARELRDEFMRSLKTLDPRPPPGTPSGADVLAAIEEARVLLGVLPGDLESAAANLRPCPIEITIESAMGTGGVELVVRRLNDITGEPVTTRALEPTRTAKGALSFSVPRGSYVFYVVQRGHGFAELEREVHDPEVVLEATAWIRPEAEVLGGMVSYPGGEASILHTFQDSEGRGEDVVLRSRLDPYWIDPGLVTTEEYERFVTERGRLRPGMWPADLSGDPLRLPATFMTYEDARDYAEWRGRRLVRRPEWMLSLQLSGTNLVPAGVDVGQILCGWPEWADPSTTDATLWQWILDHVKPVRESNSTAFGLDGTVGNVASWSGSRHFTQRRGRLERDDEHYLCGVRGREPRAGFVDTTKAKTSIYGRGYPSPDIGIRTARSARVPDID